MKGCSMPGERLEQFTKVMAILSVVMPCLNEAETLAKCIEKAKATIKEMTGR